MFYKIFRNNTRIFLIDREYFEKYEHKIKIRYFDLCSVNVDADSHLSICPKILVLCNISIDAEALCDYSDQKFLWDFDSTVFD